jgi:hypothetical protein
MVTLRGTYLRPKRRVDVKAILRDPVTRRALMIRSVIALQARAGIATTSEQAIAVPDTAGRRKAGACSAAASHR